MDPYVYPGTSVLKNLRDIRDPDLLREFEAHATSRRIRHLEHNPLPGNFDAKHLQAIHRHIFQDVYPWAGEFRTINIARSGQFYFAFPQQIEPNLAKSSTELKNERHLANLDKPAFSGRVAHYMGELNAIHPFRDGNGRTQRAFVQHLAARNEYALDWTRISRERMYAASEKSFQKGDNTDLAKVLKSTLEEVKEQRFARDSQRDRTDESKRFERSKINRTKRD